MKKVTYILVVFLMIFSSSELLAQKDSIAKQRKARKFLRDGNTLYKQQKFTDASVAYQKSFRKQHKVQ
jgi:hypothetical protein